MSRVLPQRVACPSCAHAQPALLYDSLQASLLPHERDAVLARRFELQRCAACDHLFQPEHRLLYTDLPRNLWVVMLPPAERSHALTWERDITQTFRLELDAAPLALEDALGRVSPRLVFGHSALTELAFCAHAGLDTTALECAKILYFKDNLQDLMDLGPCALRLESITSAGALRCRVDDLQGRGLGQTRDLPASLLAQAQALEDLFRQRHPRLWTALWRCASRELNP
jgi:hypothetical protein